MELLSKGRHSLFIIWQGQSRPRDFCQSVMVTIPGWDVFRACIFNSDCCFLEDCRCPSAPKSRNERHWNLHSIFHSPLRLLMPGRDSSLDDWWPLPSRLLQSKQEFLFSCSTAAQIWSFTPIFKKCCVCTLRFCSFIYKWHIHTTTLTLSVKKYTGM